MRITKKGSEWIIIPLVGTPVQHRPTHEYIEMTTEAMLWKHFN